MINFVRFASIAYFLAGSSVQPTHAFVTPSSKNTASTISPLQQATSITAATKKKLSRTGADLDSWRKGFSTCPKELPPTLLSNINLPNDFAPGTYYRNGHARFEADDGQKVLHPFDGDGMIVAMTFDPKQNQILFRNKFIETNGYMQDKETGKMSQRGIFGTMKSGGIFSNAFRTEFKNVANTNVVHVGDSLYALWEGGLPYLLDPLTLENKNGPGLKGESDLDGDIKTDNFSAHLRYDPLNKVYVNFSVKFDPEVGSTITLYELDEKTFRSTKRSANPSILTKGPGLIHDFIITKNYCIFNINKCDLDQKRALKALVGLSGFASCIDIDNSVEETSIVLIPRSLFDSKDDVTKMEFEDDDRVIVCQVPNHFNFHFGNAFEDDEGNVVFDTTQTSEMALDSMSSTTEPIWEIDDPFSQLYPNTMVRYTIDVENKCLSSKIGPKVLSTQIPEFPTIPLEMSTRSHRYLYPVAAHNPIEGHSKRGSGAAGAIQKVDCVNPELTETYSFEPHEFPGEAVFSSKLDRDITQPGQEDAGYLLVHVVNGRDKRTDLAIFDVEGKGGLEKGPIIRFQLPVFIPHMLHGNYFPEATF
jgi:all-trans-8'-apo-beta-carotenal 15,15'-oxygenase